MQQFVVVEAAEDTTEDEMEDGKDAIPSNAGTDEGDVRAGGVGVPLVPV